MIREPQHWLIDANEVDKVRPSERIDHDGGCRIAPPSLNLPAIPQALRRVHEGAVFDDVDTRPRRERGELPDQVFGFQQRNLGLDNGAGHRSDAEVAD